MKKHRFVLIEMREVWIKIEEHIKAEIVGIFWCSLKNWSPMSICALFL